ncbi:unnamed protein product, partial [Porites lobata]
MRFDPELGRNTRQHIYGEGMMDVFKSFGKKIFGKTMKKAAKKGAEKALTAAATKTGEHVGKKAGRDNDTQQQTGQFRITNGISKPRHVFVFGIDTARIDSQTANPFVYDTFDLPNNANISRCYLEVANGNEYPDIHFKPSTDLSRVFRNVMSYVYANNDYQGGTLLNRSNFKTLFPFVYFDLTKQKMDIKDGVTKLAFHYELSANPNANYNFYALVLHERIA